MLFEVQLKIARKNVHISELSACGILLSVVSKIDSQIDRSISKFVG